uniref:Interferon-induced protein 44-like n=1 Tax=Sinocyclocheilus anshuiensis TaxID=1608454 RepID=A0A671Q1S9_9TELE
MSTVTSSLNRWQKKELCSFFNNANLSLLFKASVHGFNATTFHEKCNTQGPTVIVAYNKSGRVFGAFTSKSYAQTGQNDNIWLRYNYLKIWNLREQKNLNIEKIAFKFVPMKFLAMHVINQKLSFNIFTVGNLQNIFMEHDLYPNDFWHKIKIYNFDPCNVFLAIATNIPQRLKTGFVVHGHIFAERVMAFSDGCFRPYYIKPSSSVTHVPFILCDTMGLEDGVNTGLDVDDFATILKGHIQDKYQFNPLMPIQPDSPHFHKSPGLKDKIHCVVFVIDISRVKLLSDKTIEKFVVFRKKLVLLTKVDEACPLVISSQLGVSLSVVVPVKNYYQELEIDSQTDILLLNAVVQMLRAADGYFDDFYNPEERSE